MARSGTHALKEKVKEFIQQVRSHSDSLDRGFGWDPCRIDVFRESTQAMVLQFRAPDLALFVFTNRHDRKDFDAELVVDMPVSAVADNLPKALENCEQLTFKQFLGGEVSRLDITRTGYRSVILGTIPRGWREHLRIPLIQRAISRSYGRPTEEIEVAMQNLDGTDLQSVSFNENKIGQAEREFLVLGTTIRGYMPPEP